MKEDKIYPSMVIRSQAEAIELLEKENEQLKIQISAREEVCNKYEKALFEIRNKTEQFDLGKYDYCVPVFEIQEILDKIKENQ